ncbi:hypothetical protein ANCCEY_00164 [Ancylostoma ceylanicum]|uniref:Uncharacterized protein n=1 Tax=Ancylostoma ceylanicum TaxID=53326 RepID=A0A0D6MAP5_9BILA|nr:hypothetical protein ANCCEY_00164 [Ancylostoma ceylanicum]
MLLISLTVGIPTLFFSGTMAVGWAFCAELISPKHRFKLRTFTSWELYEREEEARKRLDWINGLEPKEDSGGSKETAQKQKVARISFLRGLRDKDLRTSFLTLMVMWFCAGLSTYSIDLNGEDMTKNLWLGQYMNSLLASILRVGQTIYFLTYLTAYNSIAISWEPNYMGAAELIPTELRATSTAFLNVVTRIANVFAARTETKGVSLDKVGALQKDQKPRTPSVKEKSRSRSDRSTKGSKESKGSRESLVSKSGSKETTSEVKKEEPATGSKESAEKSDEKKESGGNLSPASKGSAESKPDKGSDEDVKKDEKKDSGSAEPLNEEK